MARVTKADEAILKEARERFRRCVDWEAVARQNALLDTRFAEGDSFNNWQWDQQVRTARGDRPCLTHNKVRQHNLMIVNDARQNKAQIKISPTGDGSTYDSAQVFAGLIRRIEYQSKAVDAYSTATFHQVQSGIGYVTVTAEYSDDDSFNQELFVRRVADPRTIYIDPDAKDYDKSDMRFAFQFVDVPRERWEKEHGQFESPPPAALDNALDTWNTRDHVREALYWRRDEDTDRVHMLRDGSTVRESDLDDAQMTAFRPLIEKSRDIKSATVEWFRIVGNRIEDRGEWAGKYIPVVPCIGEETVIDGIMDRKGHTRSQIDAQRIYNYWASAAVEQVALQTKTPFLADNRSVEGFESYWQTANIKNWSYLPYNGVGDDGQPIPPPQRSPPPEMSQAYVQGMVLARQDLLDVTGQYQAELGMPSNERSGIAIQQRQRQGDTATYHYIDNQAKMIRQVGKILVDLIPKIYDVARVMRIVGEDGREQDVILAPGAADAHQQVQMTPNGPQPVSDQQQEQIRAGQQIKNVLTIFNPSVGRYDVEADVGPSYGTQRQEAANAFSQIMAANPAAFQIVGDFWAQNSDFPGADQLADRLKRGLPPPYQPGPSPQEQQLQQQLSHVTQTAQATLQKADAHVARLQGEVATLKEQQKDKAGDLAIKDYEAETKRLEVVGGLDPVGLQMVVRQLLRDMMQTEIVPLLKQHANDEADIQQTLNPSATQMDGQQTMQPMQAGQAAE